MNGIADDVGGIVASVEVSWDWTQEMPEHKRWHPAEWQPDPTTARLTRQYNSGLEASFLWKLVWGEPWQWAMELGNEAYTHSFIDHDGYMSVWLRISDDSGNLYVSKHEIDKDRNPFDVAAGDTERIKEARLANKLWWSDKLTGIREGLCTV